MADFKSVKNWNASKTSSEQGTSFKEIVFDGKVSKLQFTIKPNSEFWRAGFKLLDPNGVVLPLRSPNSLLFHLGSTPSGNQYGFTAYLNGDEIKKLNKTNAYPANKLLTIRLEINHNNFLKVYVNDSLEFMPSWHLENPNIREKVVILAWGDEHDYSVNFRNIFAANWKGLQKRMSQGSIASQPTGQENKLTSDLSNARISAGGDIFIGSQVSTRSLKDKQSPNSVFETWWFKLLVVPLIVGLLIAYLIYKLGWNGSMNDDKRMNSAVNNASPTNTLTPTYPQPSPTFLDSNKLQRIDLGDSYYDVKSKVIIGVLKIHIDKKADISITIPGSQTEYHNNVAPGKVFYFTIGTDRYTFVMKEISFTWDYVDIIIY